MQSGIRNVQTHAEYAMLLGRGGLTDEGLRVVETAPQNEAGSFPVLYGLGLISGNL